jgi:hypothetical protein
METVHRHETRRRSICPDRIRQVTGDKERTFVPAGILPSRTGLSARDRALSNHRLWSETPNQYEAVQTSSAGQTPCIGRLTMARSLNPRFIED